MRIACYVPLGDLTAFVAAEVNLDPATTCGHLECTCFAMYYSGARFGWLKERTSIADKEQATIGMSASTIEC